MAILPLGLAYTLYSMLIIFINFFSTSLFSFFCLFCCCSCLCLSFPFFVSCFLCFRIQYVRR